MFTNISRPSAVDVLRPFAVGDSFYADTTSTLALRPIGTTNQVYIVSGGVPVWSSAISVTTLTVVDSGFTIVGSGDATKTLKFEVDAQSAGADLTIDTGAQTVDRTLSIPVLSGSDTIVTLATAQTVTGLKSFQDSAFRVVGSSDATKTLSFEVDSMTANDDLVINSGAQTDDRTATFPILTGNSILTLSNATLTTTRVPYATTNGILTDASNFFYSGTYLAVGSSSDPFSRTPGQCIAVSPASGNAGFYVNAPTGSVAETAWGVNATRYGQLACTNASFVISGFNSVPVSLGYSGTAYWSVDTSGNWQQATDGANMIFGTTTGVKLGTGTTQKIGFWNTTPIVRPSATGETVGFTAGAGTNVTDASTFTGNVGATAYRLSDIVKHLKNIGLIAP